MNKRIITDEALFWSLLESGVRVLYQVKRGGQELRVPTKTYLELRSTKDWWLQSFRHSDLPCGRYYIYTE